MVTSPLATLAGLLLGAGALGLASGVRRTEPRSHAVAARLRRGLEVAPQQLLVGGAVGIVALAVTGWPVAAGCATAGTYWALTRRARPGAAQEIERTEAIASWAEMLRDGAGTPHGIEGIVTATAPISPAPIRPTVVRFARELDWGRDLHDALPELARDLDNRIGDLIVTALGIASRSGGSHLSSVLDDLAAAARDEASRMRRDEVDRERPRSEMRQVAIVIAVTMAGFSVLGDSYLAPYDTAAGQVVLLVVAGLFGSGFAAMARLARPPKIERFLAGGGRR